MAMSGNKAPTRVSGVDLKQGEQLVRRIALHHHLLPTYRTQPPLPDTASTTLTSLLTDPSTFTSALAPPIDPAWRAHEQQPQQTDPSNQNKKLQNTNAKKSKTPVSSGVPFQRAGRKRTQLIALLRVLTPLVLARRRRQDETPSIVDFCAGCGHVGLLIAAVFPHVTVTLIDVKAIALRIAEQRAQAAGLQNVRTVQCAVREIPDDLSCDIAVALHACGDASDDVLYVAAQRRAAIVIAPCCVGSLATPISSSHLGKSGRNSSTRSQSSDINNGTVAPKSKALSSLVTENEFALLARAADFGELAEDKDHWRGIAKMILEQDRLVALKDKGYTSTILVKMRPEQCTPKNDVLVAWPADTWSGDEHALDESSWQVDQRANGMIDDFRNASLLRGLGTDEVTAVERMLREVVCDPESSGVYTSPPGGGKRARKIIHAVADGLNLVHESVGRGFERHVIVTRNRHWPIFFDYYVGVGGPHVDNMARSLANLSVVPSECVQRRRFLRGEPHHVTIVSPREVELLQENMKNDKAACVEFCYGMLFGSEMKVLGIGKVTKMLPKGIGDGDEKNSSGTVSDAYFAVIDWPEAQTLRQKLGLSPCDLHITLGFSDKDVYGKAKNRTTLIHSIDMKCSPWLQ